VRIRIAKTKAGSVLLYGAEDYAEAHPARGLWFAKVLGEMLPGETFYFHRFDLPIDEEWEEVLGEVEAGESGVDTAFAVLRVLRQG